jgi:hypothetical protein
MHTTAREYGDDIQRKNLITLFSSIKSWNTLGREMTTLLSNRAWAHLLLSSQSLLITDMANHKVFLLLKIINLLTSDKCTPVCIFTLIYEHQRQLSYFGKLVRVWKWVECAKKIINRFYLTAAAMWCFI